MTPSLPYARSLRSFCRQGKRCASDKAHLQTQATLTHKVMLGAISAGTFHSIFFLNRVAGFHSWQDTAKGTI